MLALVLPHSSHITPHATPAAQPCLNLLLKSCSASFAAAAAAAAAQKRSLMRSLWISFSVHLQHTHTRTRTHMGVACHCAPWHSRQMQQSTVPAFACSCSLDLRECVPYHQARHNTGHNMPGLPGLLPTRTKRHHAPLLPSWHGRTPPQACKPAAGLRTHTHHTPP